MTMTLTMIMVMIIMSRDMFEFVRHEVGTKRPHFHCRIVCTADANFLRWHSRWYTLSQSASCTRQALRHVQ